MINSTDIHDQNITHSQPSRQQKERVDCCRARESGTRAKREWIVVARNSERLKTLANQKLDHTRRREREATTDATASEDRGPRVEIAIDKLG
jgi:hypothetical protein